MKIKRIVFKIRLFITRIVNCILSIFVKRKDNSVFIISSDKYLNKNKEDLYLQRALIKNGVYSKIVSWESGKSTNLNVIRSVWGYHNKSEDFIKYISSINCVNSSDLIINNISKSNQYKLMIDNGISCIPTKFYDKSSDIDFTGKCVCKPCISAGGNNTVLIESSDDLSKINYSDIMVQPFIESIGEGELSVIVIDKEIRYGIIRTPGVFTSYKREKYISLFDLDEEIITIVKSIINLSEYNNCKYMRIDLVKYNDKYCVLEIELTDPDLFIETITDLKYKKHIYDVFAKTILK